MLYYSQIEIVEDTIKLQIEKSNLEFFELFFSHIGDKEKKEYSWDKWNESYKYSILYDNITDCYND